MTSQPVEEDVHQRPADGSALDGEGHQFHAGHVERVRRQVRELVEPPVARRGNPATGLCDVTS